MQRENKKKKKKKKRKIEGQSSMTTFEAAIEGIGYINWGIHDWGTSRHLPASREARGNAGALSGGWCRRGAAV